jgi:hypothetical protein
LLLDDLAGGPATDEDIVDAVLTLVGVDLLGGTIGGTGTLMGTVAPGEFTWNENETALEYIQRIDSISLGYRTFESAAGQIYRTQISSRPSGSPDFTFTEGVDIREGHSGRTVQEAYNAARVGGYAVGDFPFQGGANPDRVFSFTSSMIERRAEISGGDGISCEAVALYWLGELNREVVRLTMVTPRADLIGPGQVHLVQAAGGAAGRLGIGEKLWVQRVDVELAASGQFSQSITYIGGGAA